MNDRELMSKLVNDTDNMRYMDLCLFKTSSGNISELLPPPFDDELYDIDLVISAFQINY